MKNAQLFVKDTGSKVGVYASVPENATNGGALYRKVEGATAEAIRSSLGSFKDGFLLRQLESNGVARLGRKNTHKKALRAILAGSKAPAQVPTAPTAQVAPKEQQGETPEQKAARIKRNRQEGARKAREARARKAAERKAAAPQQQQQQQNTDDLTLEIDSLTVAREYAQATGDWSYVTRILDQQYSK